ncbi:MAG: nitroreductase/quinone reductase family protein [Chloroflexota bacterium]
MGRSQQPRADSVPNRVRIQAFASKYLTRPTPHRILYRLSGGRLGGALPGVQPRVLLLTVVGRRSGRARTSPLVYFTIDGDLVVAATNSGADTDPAWIGNLRNRPDAEVQIGAARHPIVAREAEGDERRRLWSEMKRRHPLFELYERGAVRQIPVVVLEPTAVPGSTR